ncbi:hypothetical protein [Hymenobacter elongatus]|uniref:Uncharacterized protein n=1 Tax=Hymenobacter elongatus TaxID=877208 RepID=A0A4Z0PTM4_9BACT|nr:hypothetical protein [Hymenobacter elongatus]TGE19752.1 hypothetical protein E5J99_03045 [Hymenobacter elongatus]
MSIAALGILINVLPGLDFDLPTAGALTDYVWFAPSGELFLVCLGVTVVLLGTFYTLLGKTTLLPTEPPARKRVDIAIIVACFAVVFGSWLIMQGGKKQARTALHDSVIYLLKTNGWERISLLQIRQQFGISDPAHRASNSAIALNDSRLDRLLLEIGQENQDEDLELMAFDHSSLGFKLRAGSPVRDTLCADLYRCSSQIIAQYRRTALPARQVYFSTINNVLAPDWSSSFIVSALKAYPTIFKPQVSTKDGSIVAIEIDVAKWNTAISKAIANGSIPSKGREIKNEQDTIDCVLAMMPPRLGKLRDPALLRDLTEYYDQLERSKLPIVAPSPPPAVNTSTPTDPAAAPAVASNQ